MRAWPVHRPTHAPATALKIKRNPPSSFRYFHSAQRNGNIRNLRRKAGWPSHRSSGGILSHALPWSSPRPSNRPQHKRQQHPNHRHSGIFRRGASRDGKYPESPPQGGLAFPSESRGDFFTRPGAAARRLSKSRPSRPGFLLSPSPPRFNFALGLPAGFFPPVRRTRTSPA